MPYFKQQFCVARLSEIAALATWKAEAAVAQQGGAPWAEYSFSHAPPQGLY